MSIYTLQGEPALTALADGDLILVHDASPSRAGTITAALARNYMSNGLVAATAASLDLTSAAHAGRTVTIDRAAGMVITLPAATGTGDIYRLIVKTTTAGTTTVKVNATPGTDTMIGNATLYQDAADTVVGFAAGATADTITLYVASSTTGGIAGARLTIQDIAAGLFHVDYISDAGGTEATPFSATVP
jgi:hypothetical protein